MNRLTTELAASHYISPYLCALKIGVFGYEKISYCLIGIDCGGVDGYR